MPKPVIALPDVPDGWLSPPAGTSPRASSGESGEGILGNWQSKDWSLADSALQVFLEPKTLSDIAFTDGDKIGILVPAVDPQSLWAHLPRSTDMEAGEPGAGYYTYGTDKTHRPGTAANAQWGSPKTMRVIASVASRLGNGRTYTPFGVGNISLQGGADFRPDHRGHIDGLGIDVRPARADRAQTGVSYQDNQYDREATQRLIDAFYGTGQVSKIFFNDPKVRGVQPFHGHDNHLHVQLKP